MRLRGIDLSPRVERRGERFFLMIQRCATTDEATSVRARAERVGVPCRFEDE
jgi:hypothetical protein